MIIVNPVYNSVTPGTRHQSIYCSSCGQEVWGFLWRSVNCFESGSLCSKCYVAGEQSVFHSFIRIDTDNGARLDMYNNPPLLVLLHHSTI